MRRRLIAATLATVAIVGLSACGGDDNSGLPAGSTLPGGVTLPAGVTLPPEVSIPVVPGVTPGCTEIIQAIAAAGTATTGMGDLAQAKAAMQALVGAVPDELKADAQIFANAYATFVDAVAPYNGDIAAAMADPAVAATMEALSTDEVNAASERLGDYMEAQCGNG